MNPTKTIEANYFDGLTSRSHRVDITFDIEHIKIVNNNESSINLHRWSRANTSLEDIFNEQYYSLICKDFPDQRIDVPSKEIDLVFLLSYTSSNPTKSIIHKINTSGWMGLLIMSILAIGLFVATYLYVMPAIGELLAGQLPISVEEKLGNEMFTAMSKDMMIDDEKSTLLNQYFKELHYPSPYHIKLHIVKDKTVNAFAMPGGNIVVFQGILDSMDSHTELAALLGHELTHINHKHTTKSIFRSLSAYLLVSFIFGDVSGLIATITDNTNQLIGLSYSRNLETESDEASIELMRKQGIDMDGMSQLFSKLDDPDINKNILKFISSHPITSERIAFAKKMRSSQKIILPHKELEEIFQKLK
jgi:beta-barrel assembly-enhancing protease